MTVYEFRHSPTNFHPNIRVEPLGRDLSRISDYLEANASLGEECSPGTFKTPL
jgi:hypothetical protein